MTCPDGFLPYTAREAYRFKHHTSGRYISGTSYTTAKRYRYDFPDGSYRETSSPLTHESTPIYKPGVGCRYYYEYTERNTVYFSDHDTCPLEPRDFSYDADACRCHVSISGIEVAVLNRGCNPDECSDETLTALWAVTTLDPIVDHYVHTLRDGSVLVYTYESDSSRETSFLTSLTCIYTSNTGDKMSVLAHTVCIALTAEYHDVVRCQRCKMDNPPPPTTSNCNLKPCIAVNYGYKHSWSASSGSSYVGRLLSENPDLYQHYSYVTTVGATGDYPDQPSSIVNSLPWKWTCKTSYNGLVCGICECGARQSRSVVIRYPMGKAGNYPPIPPNGESGVLAYLKSVFQDLESVSSDQTGTRRSVRPFGLLGEFGNWTLDTEIVAIVLVDQAVQAGRRDVLCPEAYCKTQDGDPLDFPGFPELPGGKPPVPPPKPPTPPPLPPPCPGVVWVANIGYLDIGRFMVGANNKQQRYGDPIIISFPDLSGTMVFQWNEFTVPNLVHDLWQRLEQLVSSNPIAARLIQSFWIVPAISNYLGCTECEGEPFIESVPITGANPWDLNWYWVCGHRSNKVAITNRTGVIPFIINQAYLGV